MGGKEEGRQVGWVEIERKERSPGGTAGFWEDFPAVFQQPPLRSPLSAPKAKVKKLLTKGDAVCGVTYEKKGLWAGGEHRRSFFLGAELIYRRPSLAFRTRLHV